MRYLALTLVLLAVPCLLGQTTNPGNVETTGACSPVAVGNNNQFTVTCQNVPEKLRAQMVDLLNLVARNQADAANVMKKLDGCISGVDEIVRKETPRHLTNEQRQAIIAALSQFKGQKIGTVVNNSNKEKREYLADLVAALTAAGWNVYERGLVLAGAEPSGVVITVGENEVRGAAVQSLVRVLKSVDVSNVTFKMERASDPDSQYMFGKLKPDDIQIQVGDKP